MPQIHSRTHYSGPRASSIHSGCILNESLKSFPIWAKPHAIFRGHRTACHIPKDCVPHTFEYTAAMGDQTHSALHEASNGKTSTNTTHPMPPGPTSHYNFCFNLGASPADCARPQFIQRLWSSLDLLPSSPLFLLLQIMSRDKIKIVIDYYRTCYSLASKKTRAKCVYAIERGSRAPPRLNRRND